jgi:mRNA interferase MazF
VSVDLYNQGPAELAVVLPLTTRAKGVRWQVPIEPPEAGLRSPGYIKCDDVRSVSMRRLGHYVGRISRDTLNEVEDRLRILMGL